MLVFISDIHLTDGTSGETIKDGAFKKFALYAEDMAVTAGTKKLEIVMLGDIIDVIRSDYWLRSKIRPWSGEKETDNEGKKLKDYAIQIVNRICNNPVNKKSIKHLTMFKKKMESKGINVKFTYLTGNHDWLVNRYPETRAKIAEFFGIDRPKQYNTQRFRRYDFWRQYRVFARHGDIYDPFNFDGDRDASSLGDAIVVDLINKFPDAVEKDIGKNTDPFLVSQLREIDNVRPIIDTPAWVHGACLRAKSVEIGERVKEVWNGLVDDFLNIGFVKEHDRSWQLDVVDAMQFGLKISKYFSVEYLASLPLRKFHKTEESYRDMAFDEEYMRRNEAEFVLYGHTHGYRIQPLDMVPLGTKTLQKTYFNTGTWRRVHVKTSYDIKSQEFLSWNVMTFIAFYLNNERGDRRFEVWNGALD